MFDVIVNVDKVSIDAFSEFQLHYTAIWYES